MQICDCFDSAILQQELSRWCMLFFIEGDVIHLSLLFSACHTDPSSDSQMEYCFLTDAYDTNSSKLCQLVSCHEKNVRCHECARHLHETKFSVFIFLSIPNQSKIYLFFCLSVCSSVSVSVSVSMSACVCTLFWFDFLSSIGGFFFITTTSLSFIRNSNKKKTPISTYEYILVISSQITIQRSS